MQDSTLVIDREHNYSVQIPEITPGGQTVEVLQEEHTGKNRMHAHSPDLSELYFEIVSYEGIAAHDVAISEQKTFLSDRSQDARISDTKRCTVHGFEATEFCFEGMLEGCSKVRRFIFVDSPIRTYRIVYDPTSRVNEQVLDSFVVETERTVRRSGDSDRPEA